MAKLITLTTDFGTRDAYVAAVKAVILTISPAATIVDLCHDIEPQNVAQAAYVFGSAYRFFPPDTVHVAVVDPGVGSRRRAIAFRAGQWLFVGPDNGVFSSVYHDSAGATLARGLRPFDPYRLRLPDDVRAMALTRPQFWRHPVSRTFHARDIFGPVAAHLSCGVGLEALGRPVHWVTALAIPQVRRLPDGSLRGHVLHVDRFGNLITSIPGGSLPRGVVVRIGKARITGLSRSYAEAAGLLAIVGSGGTLEVAVKGGSAARRLKTGVGAEVLVRRSKSEAR